MERSFVRLLCRHVVPFATLSLYAAAATPAWGQVPADPGGPWLRPGDALRLEIRDEPTLSDEYLIAEDGRVLLPLLGFVAAAGRPLQEIRRDIEEGYASELVDPVIRVTAVLRIAVLGEVRQPGLFPVDATHSVSDLLAAAGGLTPAGDPGQISVLRDGTEIELTLDPESLLVGTSLVSGDRILVGRRGFLAENQTVLVGALASVAAAGLTALIIR
jgi:polysaccharide export outer membrane protein